MVQSSEDDHALIDQAHSGDAEAFAALVRRYQGLVHGCALALLGDPHLAQDVAQETFLYLFRQLARLREAKALPGYLRVITRRTAMRLVRQGQREEAAWQTLRPDLGRSRDDPRQAERRELQQTALRTLHYLAPLLREVLILHYLKGCSHREIAVFLSVPRTTVNNRLHAARKALAKETLKMVSKTREAHALPEDFADRIGRIIAAQGPVVDVQFDEGLPQEEHDVLVGTERNRRLVAIQRRPDGLVRCLSARVAGQRLTSGRVVWVNMGEEALEIGQSVAAAPTEPVPKIGDEEIAELVEALTPREAALNEMLATGLKSLDLLFPLAKGGRVQLLGPHGNTSQVLIYELCLRLRDRQDANLLSMFNIVQPLELTQLHRRRERPDLFFPGFNEGNTQQVQTFVIPRGEPSRLPVGPAASPFDAILCFDRYEAAVMRYPNFDVARSCSRLLEKGLVSDEHRQTAEAVRRTLLASDELTADATYLRLVGNDATYEARHRWEAFFPKRLQQLSPPQRATVERAQRLRAYLTTPFLATQEAFEIPGQWVDLADTLRDCQAILNGVYDGVPAEKLMNIGSLEGTR